MNGKSTTGVKIGICAVALMGMGVVGVASALSVIGAHFSNASQTMIQNMMTIPAIVIIFTTIICGKLMEKVSKKKIALFGTICFIVGGIGPAFVDNLTVILVLRGVVGVGIGIAQVAMTALTAENFEGEEREKVQGVVQASQMGAMGLMSICGGFLAQISWNLTFWVYAIGIISFFALLLLVPDKKPVAVADNGEKPKTKITKGCVGWVVVMFVGFIGIMVYSAYVAYLFAEKQVGTSADSGISLALFAIAGIIVGVVYGKFVGVVKNKMIALSLILMAVAYLIMAIPYSAIAIHVGSFLTGWTLSMFMPAIFLNTGLSVDPWSVPMAISLVTMAQNLGQFACPYILNPLAAGISGGVEPIKVTFIIGAAIMAAVGVCTLIWGVKKDKQLAA